MMIDIMSCRLRRYTKSLEKKMLKDYENIGKHVAATLD
jgi:hypothetical protein